MVLRWFRSMESETPMMHSPYVMAFVPPVLNSSSTLTPIYSSLLNFLIIFLKFLWRFFFEHDT